MLAAKVDQEVGSPAKRKSMLSKTMKAIGKVKPKFKKSSKKNFQMELHDSCDSDAFNLSDLDKSDDDSDGENSNNEAEEENGQKIDVIEELPDNEEVGENSEGHISMSWERKGRSTPSPATVKEGSSHRENYILNSPPSTPTSLKRSRRKGSEEISADAPATPTSVNHQSGAPKPSRRRSMHRKSGPRSPAPKSVTSPRQKILEHVSQAIDRTDDRHSSGRRTPSSQSKRTVEGGELVSPKVSARLLVQGPQEQQQQHEQQQPHSPHPEEKIEDSEESLKRCSMVFGDDSALGGYFAKLQDLKQKDPTKPASYHVRTGPDSTTEPLKHQSAHNLGKGVEDKTNRNFKPSKNIRKLFGLNRSTSKDDSKESPSADKAANSNSDYKDEAAKLMLELSTILSPGSAERPVKSYTTRPSRSLHVGGINLEEDEDDDATQEFPEIPTAKKTSLSDIRKSMEASKVDQPGSRSNTASIQNSTKKGTTESSRGPRPQQQNAQRRSSIDNSRSTRRDDSDRLTSPRKPPKNSNSPTSVTDAIDSNDNKESREKAEEVPPAPDDSAHSPGSRRSRHRQGKRPPSDPSSAQEAKTISVEAKVPPRADREGVSGDNTNEPSGEKLTSTQTTSRRRRGSSRHTSSGQEPIPEDAILEAANTNGSTEEAIERSPSPGSLRGRRSAHRRGNDKNEKKPPNGLPITGRRSNSESTKMEKGESSLLEPDAGTEKEEGTQESGNSNRRPRKIESRVRTIPDEKSQKSRHGDGTRAKYTRSASMSSLGKPPIDPSTAQTRRQSKAVEHGKLDPDTEKAAPVEQEILALLHASNSLQQIDKQCDESGIENRSKSPSLSESLEKGALKRILGNDCYSVSTDEGSEMFVKGKISYSAIRSDESVSAPQLIISPDEMKTDDLQVKNV